MVYEAYDESALVDGVHSGMTGARVISTALDIGEYYNKFSNEWDTEEVINAFQEFIDANQD